MLQRSRSGQGWTWWRLAEITDIDSEYWFPDGTRERLPPQFDAVELTAVQVGSGLTAVVGFFHLTSEGSREVDVVWHRSHEPHLLRGKGRPKALSRMWAGLRNTQLARRAHHDAARKWLAKRCPGFFSANGEPQPLMDLLLLEQYDPMPSDPRERSLSDALRAIGLTEHTVRHRTSPQLPRMLLSQAEPVLCPDLGERTWALWGQREAIAAADKHLNHYGSDVDQAIARRAHDSMRNLLTLLSVSYLQDIVEERHAVMRDSARTRHGKFKARDLRQLRTSFLTLSLDLTSMARDVEEFWGRKWRDADDAQFVSSLAPWIIREDVKRGSKSPSPIRMNDELRESQEKRFSQLIESDRDYRDILSTVASLGASIDTFKISRVAIWITFVSLIVALAAILMAEPESDSVCERESQMDSSFLWSESKNSQSVADSGRGTLIPSSYLSAEPVRGPITPACS